jgi:CDP-diacylglycerol--glycerol-3-phosphate 3-phosphatidyltransferase
MVSIRSYQGPMGKSDRAFFVGLLSLLLYFFPLIQNYLEIIFGLAILLLTITCMNRLKTIFS